MSIEFEKAWTSFIDLINIKFTKGNMKEETKVMLKDYWLAKGEKELKENYLRIKAKGVDLEVS